MADYIKREDAINAIFSNKFTPSVVRRVLRQIPSADVVEVVRCKDCKHYAYAPVNDGWNSCDRDALIRHESFFCASGERMDGEE